MVFELLSFFPFPLISKLIRYDNFDEFIDHPEFNLINLATVYLVLTHQIFDVRAP